MRSLTSTIFAQPLADNPGTEPHTWPQRLPAPCGPGVTCGKKLPNKQRGRRRSPGRRPGVGIRTCFGTRSRPGMAGGAPLPPLPMNCPKCGKILEPDRHGQMVFDGQVWCDRCHRYDKRLLELRPFRDLETWAQRLCRAFAQDPVHLRHDPDYLPDPRKYWTGATFLLGEAFHEPRCVMLHPPGHQFDPLPRTGPSLHGPGSYRNLGPDFCGPGCLGQGAALIPNSKQ